MRNITETCYDNLWGLSCVENQVLAIMCAENIDRSFVYANSLIPLKKLHTFFFIEKKEYAYFDGVPKAQDLLRDSGMLELKLLEDISASEVYRRLLHSRVYVLLKTDPRYMEKIFYKRPMRDDHFVLAQKSENGVMLFNDIPVNGREVLYGELKEAYAGKAITLSFSEIRLQYEFSELNQRLIKQARKMQCRSFSTGYDDIGAEENGEKLRDLVGIYKLTLQRLAEFYRNRYQYEILLEQIKLLSRLYVQLSYAVLRRKCDQGLLRDTWNKLLEIEAAVYLTISFSKETVTNR